MVGQNQRKMSLSDKELILSFYIPTDAFRFTMSEAIALSCDCRDEIVTAYWDMFATVDACRLDNDAFNLASPTVTADEIDASLIEVVAESDVREFERDDSANVARAVSLLMDATKLVMLFLLTVKVLPCEVIDDCIAIVDCDSKEICDDRVPS